MDSVKRDLDPSQQNSYPRIYKSPTIHTAFFVLAGIVLVLGGLAIIRFFINELHNSLAVVVFVAILPAPMLCFGLYVVISTIRYKAILLPDAIKIHEGISTITIPRNQVTAYQLSRNDKQLELKMASSPEKHTVPLAIKLDSEFIDWFENAKKVPEFKEPKPLDTAIYPRVYKPNRRNIFICGAICFILSGALIQVFVQSPEIFNMDRIDNRLWEIIVTFALSLFLIYKLIIVSIGYKVTLMSDAIEVTNFIKTKTLQRNDICSYYYYSGRTESGVVLISSNPAKIGSDIPLLYNSDEKVLRIPFTFNRDQEFNDWIYSIPCTIGGTPLPKIREELE